MFLAALPWGQGQVVAVELTAPGAFEPQRLRQVFGVQVGDRLDREAIRRGIQALVASGEVEDVRVDVEPRGDGFALLLHAQVATRVGSLRLEGLPSRQRALVAQELGLKPGLPLRLAPFEQALVRAQGKLRADGFPQARLEPELEFHVQQGTVDVILRGWLGPPRVLCQLEADGFPGQQQELWQACDVRPHRRLTAGTTEGMRRRLLASLRREGYWQAEVEGPQLSDLSCGTKARFVVKAGPRFRLRMEGDPVSRSLLNESFPFLSGEDGLFAGAEGWLAARLREALQRQGYLQPMVDVQLQAWETEQPTLVVRVARGPKLPIVAVRFPGLEGQTLTELARRRVAVRTGALGRLAGQTVDDASLAADREAVEATLKAEGYPQAQVAPARLVREGQGWVVEFPVALGERWTVEGLELQGWPVELPLPSLPLAAGKAWSLWAEEETRRLLLEALANAGFPDAQVEVEGQCWEGRCQPVARVAPGIRATVKQVVVAGLARTKPQVVNLIAGLKAGDLYASDALLAAQRRLLALGIFSRVSLGPVPGQETGSQRGVLIQLQEGPSRSVSGGLGWDTEEKLRLSASWTELNLFGKARTLSFEGRISSRQRRLQVNYREPARLGFLGLPTWVAIYRTEERFPTYSLLRRGMWVELGDHWQRPRRWLVRYDYQIIVPEAPEEVLSSLERSRQHLRVASLTPVLEWDTRDDPFFPSRGLYASLQVQRAFPLFLADASFAKFQGSLAWLKPLGSSVVALGVRGGVIRAFQGSRPTPDNLRVPIAARFFAGGRVSHRAFPTDRLGVPGQTLLCPEGKPSCTVDELRPVGGAALLLASAEWRVPIAGSLGGTIFVDGGNTWASLAKVREADLRWGAGLGLRFETPVGPLRLEYGWKLDREPGESKGELYLAFGNPF